MSNGDQYRRMATLAMKRDPSVGATLAMKRDPSVLSGSGPALVGGALVALAAMVVKSA